MRSAPILAITLAFASVLTACGNHPAASTQPSPVPLSREQARADAVVLAQLERDLAVLERERQIAVGDPAAFQAARAAISEQLRKSDAAMLDAARINPPPVGVSYPKHYEKALAQRNLRAVVLARQQYAEKESTVAYEYERAHAGQTLRLRLRLQTLHFDAKAQAKLRAQIAALDAQEVAVVSAQRLQDEGALARYRATLDAQSDRERTEMGADVRARPTVRFDRAVAHVNVAQALQKAAASGYDIDSRFAQLEEADARNTRDLDAEIAALRAECARLAAAEARSSR